MASQLRKIIFWLLGITAFVVGILFAAQRYLGPEIQKIFVSEINKSLAAQVEVDGVSLSLFKDFPHASVRFQGVRMKEAGSIPSKKYLLKAKTISLRFNLLDIVRKKYKVKVLRLTNLEVSPHVFSDGTDNYHFWKSTSSAANQNFAFELQKIVLTNIHLIYTNESTQTLIDATLPGFVATGKFSSEQYTLTLAGAVAMKQFKMHDTEYSGERILNLWLALDADNKNGTYKITDGRIETGKLQLKADGQITYSNVKKALNLSIAAQGSTLEEMISLVPQNFSNRLNGYDFKGKADIQTTISGRFGDKYLPSISVRLDLNNGSISEKSSGVSFREVSVVASYVLKDNGKSETITINNLKAKLGDGLINGALVLNGLQASNVQSTFNVSVNLNELQQFLKSKYFQSMSGWLSIKGAFDGNISNLSHPTSDDIRNSNFSGSGSIQQAEVKLTDYSLPITKINARFTFNGNDLQMQQVAMLVGKSDFNFNCTLSNLIGWTYNNNENLGINGTLQTSRFDWDELSAAQNTHKGYSKEYNFSLPESIDISKLQFRCNSFTFSTFTATALSGNIQMIDKVLTANSILMQTSKGKVAGQFTINARAAEHSFIQAKANLNQVNVSSLFTQFANFGQDDLKAENLEGTISADIVFAAKMLNNLDIDLNSVKAHADIQIDNGRLVNYKPMQSLSSFLRVEDLADIRFQTLVNQIDIANQVIFIPSMSVKSSALDLELMGTHTFNNDLDYHFVIGLADLLAAKYKRKNTGYDSQLEFGTPEEDGRGKTKLYVSLTGTIDKPVVKYDKKAVRQKITSELQQQKVELKQILKQEFKWFASDSIRKIQQSKDKEIQKKQEEGKFVIEWDEDPK